jgi:tetratricopeptide (TPR) repeat protein
MRLRLAALLLLVPALAGAQELADYNRGLTAFNGGNYDVAVQHFYVLAERSSDADVKRKSQYYLAQALAKKGFPAAASIYDAEIVKAGAEHPYYLEAVKALAELQEQLKDPFLIPSMLDAQYQPAWKGQLPPQVAAKVSYLVATSKLRGDKLQEAQELLRSVPQDSAVYAKARYLLGIVYSNPRFPEGPKTDEAVKAFQDVLAVKDARQLDLEQTRQLALLGLGRVYYGAGEYAKARAAYEKVPRFSRYWDQALFENGFARFRDEDYGGALGSLQALHAPQFEGAFQPESWVLKATVYHFSCLFNESKASLAEFERIYLPMSETLKPLVEAKPEDYSSYHALVADPKNDKLPRPVLLWVRANERVRGVFDLIARIDKEKAELVAVDAWKGTLGAELASYLDQNRGTLVQTAGKLVKNRLTEAYQNIRKFSNDGDLIRLETTLAQKRLLDQSVDQRKMLADQALHRPGMPGENWDYWQFQGEFWIDEIGYYQYTLKKGCPLQEKE